MSWKGDLIHAGILSDGGKLRLTGLGGAFATTHLLGAGTAADPAEWAAGGNAIQFYFKNTYASGGARGLYLRTYFASGSSGDCARIFATVNADTGTVQGAHISLSFATGANLSGLGVACRNTIHVPNEAIAANGTYCAHQAEVYMDGTDSDPSAATAFSIGRVVVDGGDATARARVKNYLSFSVPTGAYNGGNMHATTNDATVTDAIRCLINGSVRYMLFSTSLIAP